MKHLLRIMFVCIFFSFSPVFGEEEEINLDDFKEEVKTDSQPALLNFQGIKLNLYADFTLDWGIQPVGTGYDIRSNLVLSNVGMFSFNQNHFQVMGKVSYKDFVSVFFDIANPYNFFEVQFNILTNIRIKFGKIFVPFGEYDFHHIYGGRMDDQNSFLPKFWCDYGISVNFSLFDFSKMDLYMVNGFPVSGGVPVITTPNGRDNNLSKALGMKWRFDPYSWLFCSASLYYDIFSTYDYYTDFTFFYGADIGFKRDIFSLKAGILIGEMSIPDKGFTTSLIFNDTYNRYGYYIELRSILSEDL